MTESEILEKLKRFIVEGEIEQANAQAKLALEYKIDVKLILEEAIIKAADEVGKLYEEEEYFLADMLMAGDAIQGVMNLIKPAFEKSSQKAKGIVLIGTVEGDIHSIGKTLVVSLLCGQGFEVVDLGVEVLPKTFIEKARELNPDIIGLSGLLTTSLSKMHETIIELKKEKIPSKIIIGGGVVSKNFCVMVGADDCAKDGWEGIKKINKLVSNSMGGSN